jgi:hypothetical protein
VTVQHYAAIYPVLDQRVQKLSFKPQQSQMVRIEEFTHINASLNSADSACFASTLALALNTAQ